MCICCDGTDNIKPMSEFTAYELATANSCCLKPTGIDWDDSSLLQDIEGWVDSMLSELSQDNDDLLVF